MGRQHRIAFRARFQETERRGWPVCIAGCGGLVGNPAAARQRIARKPLVRDLQRSKKSGACMGIARDHASIEKVNRQCFMKTGRHAPRLCRLNAGMDYGGDNPSGLERHLCPGRRMDGDLKKMDDHR